MGHVHVMRTISTNYSLRLTNYNLYIDLYIIYTSIIYIVRREQCFRAAPKLEWGGNEGKALKQGSALLSLIPRDVFRNGSK